MGEWMPPKNVSLSKCPFCSASILLLSSQDNKLLTTEEILQNLLSVYGIEILQHEEQLSGMISDFFTHDKKTQKLLLTSIKEHVPRNIVALLESDELELRLLELQNQLKEDSFLHDEAINQIIRYWRTALHLVAPIDNAFEIIWRRGFCGFKISNGIMITDFIFDDASLFSGGLAGVQILGKWGFIDTTGKEVIPLKYSSVGNFKEGLCRVYFDKNCGFIDKAGKEIIALKYDWAEDYKEGLSKVRKDGKEGLIDVNGDVVIPIIYDSIEDFEQGLAKVKMYRFDR